MRFILGTLLFFFAGLSVSAQPVVTNHKPGSEVRYPVVILKGTVDEGTKLIQAKNESSNLNSGTIKGETSGGKFKVLVELVPGENRITLSADESKKTDLILNYKAQTNPHYVRVIWMTDKGGATNYATSYEKDPQNYLEKLDLAAKMLQTFSAERMFDAGYGRKTFKLELDGDTGKVKVHTLSAPKEAAHYYSIGDQQWYREINQWLNKEYPDPFVKNIVIASYTRKNPETGKMQAHTALGGGNMGLFGGASVFSWPDSIQDITHTFLSDEKIDPAKVHDDSAGRHTVWGLASTTLGATLHEMGHAFGLPHCTDPNGIMTRGFDKLNRAFTFVDPPGGRRLKAIPFQDNDVAYFAPISASYLQWSRWFQLDAPPFMDSSRPRITLFHESGDIKIESETPIHWVGFWQKDSVSKFKEFTGEQTNILIPAGEWKSILGSDDLTRISAIAENGLDAVLRLDKK